MIRPFCLAMAVAAVAGCTNYPGPSQLATAPAPAFEVVKADIDENMCRTETNQIAYGGPVKRSERPLPLITCRAYYPRYMLNANVQGACAAMFDLGDDGKATNLEIRCNVGAPGRDVPADWAAVAKQGFTYSVERQLTSWRYPIKGEELSGQRRHTIYLGTDFMIGGREFAPEDALPFQRAAPAPPLPQDIIDRIEEIRSKP